MLETYYKEVEKVCSSSLFSVNRQGSQIFSVYRAKEVQARKEEEDFYQHDRNSAVADPEGSCIK